MEATLKRIGALHWQGDEKRLASFVGRHWQSHDGKTQVYNVGTHEWLVVPLGAWVFKLKNGDLMVVADEAVRLYALLHDGGEPLGLMP